MLKAFSFSDLAVKAANSENKKGFSTSEKARISLLALSPLKLTSRCFYYWLAPQCLYSKRALPIL